MRIYKLFLLAAIAAACCFSEQAADPRLVGFVQPGSSELEPHLCAPDPDPRKRGPSVVEDGACALKESDLNKRIAGLRKVLDVAKSPRSFLKFALYNDLHNDFISALESVRTDKQTGAGPQGSGTTSLVSKASVPAVLSAAVEEGALVQTVRSGPQATFRGNLLGIGRLILGDDQFPFCPNTTQPCGSLFVRAFEPVSFSVSMDANSQKPVSVPVTGSATPQTPATMSAVPGSVSLTGSGQRVSSWGVRYAILNPRALNSESNRSAFASALAAPAGNVLSNLDAVFGTPDLKAYEAWKEDAAKDMAALSPDTSGAAFETRYARHLDDLVSLLNESNPNSHAAMLAAWRSYDAYFGSRRQALESLSMGTMLSFEYTDNAALDQPRTSNFRLIVSKPLTSRVLFTANLAAETYNTLPAGVTLSRFRDAQASMELDISTGQMGNLGVPYFSAAGYYQYMHDPGLIVLNAASLAPGTNIVLPASASTLLGQKGNIAIGQLKLTLPFKTTGVSFPMAVTWANRSELIKGTNVSGHIGISFDLDSLLAAGK